MITATQTLQKIQEISCHYISGAPPIYINGLTLELDVSKSELLVALNELERKELITFYNTTHDAFKLTLKGIQNRIDTELKAS